MEGISEVDAMDVIRIGCHYKTGDKLKCMYDNIDELLEHIEAIKRDLKLREEVWTRSRVSTTTVKHKQVTPNGNRAFSKNTHGSAKSNFDILKKNCVEKRNFLVRFSRAYGKRRLRQMWQT